MIAQSYGPFFLALTLSNNVPYKKIIFKLYTVSPIYIRIGLLSKLEILKVIEYNFFIVIK